MAEGQFLGKKKVYLYTDESGAVYFLRLDSTLGDLPGTGLIPAVAGNTGLPAPKRFQPRGVFWQGTLNGEIKRKFLICASTGVLYQADSSQSLTIDGVAGVTTGRKGERLSYVRLPPAPPAT